MIRHFIFPFFIIFITAFFPPELLSFDLKSQVKSFALSNGMRWLIVERSQAPVFSGVVMVRVGSAEEEKGKTGLAHMFEHMALKGSSHLGTRNFKKEEPLLHQLNELGRELTELSRQKADAAVQQERQARMKEVQKQIAAFQVPNEVWDVMLRNGGDDLNAFTSKDVTAFHASMPAERFELWAYVFAELISDPVLRDFYTERDVVAEELRLSVENDPDGKLAETLLNTAYADGPYQWSTIGLKEDVISLNHADALAFHRRHYVAVNMVGVLVGDVHAAHARPILERYFGRIPKGAPSPDPVPSVGRGGEERTIALDAEPAWVAAFHIPTFPDGEVYSIEAVISLLCDGASSRLEKKLIVEKRVAREVSCSSGFPGSRLPHLAYIWVEPLQGKSGTAIKRIVLDELKMLQRQKIPAIELESVKKREQAHFVYAMEHNKGLATTLGSFEAIFGEWELVADYVDKISAVTAEDIKRVAEKYFVPENMVLVERVKGNGE